MRAATTAHSPIRYDPNRECLMDVGLSLYRLFCGASIGLFVYHVILASFWPSVGAWCCATKKQKTEQEEENGDKENQGENAGADAGAGEEFLCTSLLH